MAHFILVHGSGQSAASWERVARLLRDEGHDVAAPDLPKGSPPRSPAEHAAVIAAAMSASEPAVVVAHSLCGALLPWVAAVRPCRALVFVAAVLPDAGRSVREQFAADPEMFDPAWIAEGARWFDPSAREDLARHFLFHDCDAATAEWALATIDPALVVTTAAVALPRHCAFAAVVATRDRTLSPAWIERRARSMLGVEPITIDAGHCPHVSRPAEVAAALSLIAAQASRDTRSPSP